MVTVSFSPTKSELPAGKTIASRKNQRFFCCFQWQRKCRGVCAFVSKVTANLHISIQSEIKDMGPAQATLEVHMLKTPALKSWRNESYLKQGYDPWRRGREVEQENVSIDGAKRRAGNQSRSAGAKTLRTNGQIS